ncbi:MAG: HEAT repeat domain-containing protein [Nitrospirae bacterium]|nr:MAG: HEAT repeat domain-containing protein [Nitrospirota bacterium]
MNRRQQSPSFWGCVIRAIGIAMTLLSLNPERGENCALAAERSHAATLGTVALQIEASTWKQRGHIIYDIEGSIRKKLINAGFKVLRDAVAPYDHLLTVTYRETRGAEYAFNAFGTVITCRFQFLIHPSQPMMDFQVMETSTNSVSGTPPYLDAVHRFETNPYYFFLGDILAGSVLKSLNLREALLWAVERHLSAFRQIQDPDDRALERSEHYMMSSQEFYRPFAIRRTIQLFIEANDPAMVPLWQALIHDPDPMVRIQAIEMVEAFHVVDARAELAKLAAEDVNPQVRDRAGNVMTSLDHGR